MTSSWRRPLETEDAYGLLLLVIVITFVLSAVIEPTRWGRLVLAAANGSMLLLALFASHARPRLLRGGAIAVGVAFAVVLFEAITNIDSLGSSVFVLEGLLLVISPAVIVNRILRHTEVRLSTVVGAICAYLLIGMVFGLVYATIGKIDGPFFSTHSSVDTFDYFYFSYTSLTTTGYGDFVAKADLGRSFAVLEQVTGQVFLVTLVARLVATFSGVRRRRDDSSTPA